MGQLRDVYASPTQGEGELPPPENVIFCDTTTSIQYRYIQSQAQTYTDTVKHGFTEVPGTRTVNPGYGIEITKAADANLTVKARKPRQYIGKGSSSPNDRMYIGASSSGLQKLTATPYMALHITDESGHYQFTVSGLVDNGDVDDPYETVAYHVDLELACWPYTKTANIITLNVSDATTSTPVVMSSADFDMSSLASISEPDTVVFSFDFVTRIDTKTFQVEIANGDGTNNQVYAYVKRISISELL